MKAVQKEVEGTENWYRKKKRKPCARCILTALTLGFLGLAGILMFMMHLQG